MSEGGLFRATFFYLDDGLIASTYPECLQLAFDTLTGLFNRVGIWTNVKNTVGILCHPCRTVGTQSGEAYESHMTGAGLTYWSRQQLPFQCP